MLNRRTDPFFFSFLCGNNNLKNKKMAYTWINISVFNYHQYMGSFYTNSENKDEWIKEINEKYGVNCWTKYNVEY